MSFILDALKKSELERQRQSSPGLIEAGVSKPRPRLPLWAVALMVLLGVNLLALVIVASRSGFFGQVAAIRAPATPAATPAAAAAVTVAPGVTRAAAEAASPTGAPSPVGAASPAGTASPAAMPAAAPAAGVGANDASAHFSPMDGAPEYAPEIPVAQKETRPAAAPRAAHSHEKPVEAPQPIDEPPDEVLPSISEINMAGPELHLDVHVFATQPAERFVYINMRKYREGQTLEEGPTVERIRRDGVVLSYQGIRFLLPRQR